MNLDSLLPPSPQPGPRRSSSVATNEKRWLVCGSAMLHRRGAAPAGWAHWAAAAAATVARQAEASRGEVSLPKAAIYSRRDDYPRCGLVFLLGAPAQAPALLLGRCFSDHTLSHSDTIPYPNSALTQTCLRSTIALKNLPENLQFFSNHFFYLKKNYFFNS